MVGGKVIGLARSKDSTLVHVQDTTYKTDRCSVRVVERRRSDNEPVEIEIGDSIWWQCGWCMWTPAKNLALARPDGHASLRCGVDYDIQLPKVGYSH